MAGKRKAALGFIFITLLIDITGIGIIVPVIPTLVMELTGKPISEASLYGNTLLAVYAVAQFLFAPVIGNLSDRFGRRPVLLVSLLGFGLDYIFLAFAPTIGWLFLGRIIAGVMGASFTTGAAYIADISTPENRAQNFGMIGAAFGLGFIIGPTIGGLLGELGSRVPFLAAAALSLLNCLYGYFILPESLSMENRRPFEWKRANPIGTLKQLKRYPVISGLIVSIFLVYLAAHAVQSNWVYYTEYKFGWTEFMVGVSLGAVGLISAVVQGGLIRIIIPKLGQERSLYVGMALYCVGYVLFAFATEGWMMFAILLPYCLGGIAGPALQGIMSTQIPANEQGELQGGLTSLMSLAAILGPLMMAALFYFFTKKDAVVHFSGAPMMMGAVLTLISWGLARTHLKKHLAQQL